MRNNQIFKINIIIKIEMHLRVVYKSPAPVVRLYDTNVKIVIMLEKRRKI